MTTSGGPFVSGLDLARALYEEGVRPVLRDVAPGVPHAAARVGAGSEVLGFDTARSADHDWGPRLDLFLRAEDHQRLARGIGLALAERLPKQVRGGRRIFGRAVVRWTRWGTWR